MRVEMLSGKICNFIEASGYDCMKNKLIMLSVIMWKVKQFFYFFFCCSSSLFFCRINKPQICYFFNIFPCDIQKLDKLWPGKYRLISHNPLIVSFSFNSPHVSFCGKRVWKLFVNYYYL